MGKVGVWVDVEGRTNTESEREGKKRQREVGKSELKKMSHVSSMHGVSSVEDSSAFFSSVASINSSFEGTSRRMLERNTQIREHAPEKKTRVSQLLSYFDTSDPGDPYCYYHHPQETETDCEKEENRELPSDLWGPFGMAPHLLPQLQQLQCSVKRHSRTNGGICDSS